MDRTDYLYATIGFVYRRLPGGRVLLSLLDRAALSYLERRYAIIGRTSGWVGRAVTEQRSN